MIRFSASRDIIERILTVIYLKGRIDGRLGELEEECKDVAIKYYEKFFKTLEDD